MNGRGRFEIGRFCILASGVLFTLVCLIVAFQVRSFAIPILLTYLSLALVTLYACCDYHQRARLEWVVADFLDHCGKELLLTFLGLVVITCAMKA